MDYNIDTKYSVYSASIIFHLLRSSKAYNDLFVKHHPDLAGPLTNFYSNEDCGCRANIYKRYKKLRFQIDLMTVKFINENPECIDIKSFCDSIGELNLKGTMFSIPNTESDLKDFLSKMNIKNASYSGFNTIVIDDRILITFY